MIGKYLSQRELTFLYQY